MRRKTDLPELLSPAGDFECLVAAVSAGADAVYVGAREFSARAYAKNFDLDEIERASAYCHLHGVKLYVTVNTLLYTYEIPDALKLAGELRSRGVDAVISADLGFIKEAKRLFPDLELHASTQMSVHNSYGADEAYRLGCTRVVLARELSLANITKTTEKCLPECEVFLHGALCVSHSGQCLFSSLVGGRSGNRGECAQPCRLPYQGDKYPLSLKDLSLAVHIPSLIDSGVASLKIEGRMKSPDYVYTVTKIYRRLLDERRGATQTEMRELERIFSRSGFTDGYYKADLGRGMTGIRQKSDIDSTRALASGSYQIEKLSVKASAVFKLGEPSSFTLYIPTARSREGYSVTATGDIPMPSLTSPLKRDDVIARLCKMGNTYLSLKPEDVTLELDEGINLPISALNALRRLSAELAEGYGRPEFKEIQPLSKIDTSLGADIGRTALFFGDTASGLSEDALGYFDVTFVPLFSYERFCKSINGVYVPPVVTEEEIPEVERELTRATSLGAKYALVSNIGAIKMASDKGLIPIGDFRLNVMNSYSKNALSALGLSDTVLSPELNDKASSAIGGRAVVYGRIPLMLTERCFIGENFGCDKCSSARLLDRRGVDFPMIREWKHRNIILNSQPTYTADILAKYRTSARLLEHYIFSVESAREIERVIDAYKKGLPTKDKYRRMGRREVNQK